MTRHTWRNPIFIAPINRSEGSLLAKVKQHERFSELSTVTANLLHSEVTTALKWHKSRSSWWFNQFSLRNSANMMFSQLNSRDSQARFWWKIAHVR